LRPADAQAEGDLIAGIVGFPDPWFRRVRRGPTVRLARAILVGAVPAVFALTALTASASRAADDPAAAIDAAAKPRWQHWSSA
jgi:hypothetical protein